MNSSSPRSSPGTPERVVAVLGPTNTGKTHLAIERMAAHGSGMIGLPLRLLAREVYDRMVRLKGQRAVALVTGEEKISPDGARYFICTAEAMPLDRQVDFLALDDGPAREQSVDVDIAVRRHLARGGRADELIVRAEELPCEDTTWPE